MAGELRMAPGIPDTSRFRHHAGEQGPGAERNDVGFGDGRQGGVERPHALRNQAHRRMGLRLRLMRVSPTTREPSSRRASRPTRSPVAGKIRPPIFRTSAEAATASGKSPIMCVRAVRKQVSKAVAFQPAAALKAILEQAGKQGLVLRQRHQAVADVAGRQDVEIAPQPPGACRRRR